MGQGAAVTGSPAVSAHHQQLVPALDTCWSCGARPTPGELAAARQDLHQALMLLDKARPLLPALLKAWAAAAAAAGNASPTAGSGSGSGGWGPEQRLLVQQQAVFLALGLRARDLQSRHLPPASLQLGRALHWVAEAGAEAAEAWPAPSGAPPLPSAPGGRARPAETGGGEIGPGPLAAEGLRCALDSVRLLAVQYGGCSTEVAFELQLLQRLLPPAPPDDATARMTRMAAGMGGDAHNGAPCPDADGMTAPSSSSSSCPVCGGSCQGHAGSIGARLEALLGAAAGAAAPHGSAGFASEAGCIAMCILWHHYGEACWAA